MEDVATLHVPPKYLEMKDFHEYYSGVSKAPMLTIFIGGNHESSSYMRELHYGGWAAPNIYYLGASNVINVGPLRIASMSGIWKAYDFRKSYHERLPFNEDDKMSVYHVRETDVRKLLNMRTQVDIGISHDWPRDVVWEGNFTTLFRKKRGFEEDANMGKLGSVAAKLAMDHLRPPYWFSGHLHVKFSAIIEYKDKTPSPTGAEEFAKKRGLSPTSQQSSQSPKKVYISNTATPQIRNQATSAWAKFANTAATSERSSAHAAWLAEAIAKQNAPTSPVPVRTVSYETTWKKTVVDKVTGKRRVSNQPVEPAQVGGAAKGPPAIEEISEFCDGDDGVKINAVKNEDEIDVLSGSDSTPSKGTPEVEPAHSHSGAPAVQNKDEIVIDSDSSESDDTTSAHDSALHLVQHSPRLAKARIENAGLGYCLDGADKGAVRKADETDYPMGLDGQSESREDSEAVEIKENVAPINADVTGIATYANMDTGTVIEPVAEQPLELKTPSLAGSESRAIQEPLVTENIAVTETNSNSDAASTQPHDSPRNADNGVSEEIRSQLPASFSVPQKSASHDVQAPTRPPGITNKTVNFLALDKPVGAQNRDYVQLMALKSLTKSDEPVKKPLRLTFDKEWLAITRTMSSEILYGDKDVSAPRDKGADYYAPLIDKEMEWVEENVIKKGLLEIPDNFVHTAPWYINGSEVPDLQNASQPLEYTNPQTQYFCDLIGIENKFAIDDETALARNQKGAAPSSFVFRGRGRGRGRPRGGPRGGGGDHRGGSSFNSGQRAYNSFNSSPGFGRGGSRGGRGGYGSRGGRGGS